MGFYRALDTLGEVQALADRLMGDDLPVAFDTETGYDGSPRESGALRVYEPTQFIVGLSLTNSVEWASYLPLNHDHHHNLPEHEVWEILKPVFEQKIILAHNLAFDLRNVQALPIKERGPEIVINRFEDTLLQSYVLAQTQLHGLKHLTHHYFDYEQASLKSLFPDQTAWTFADAKKLRFNGLPITPEVVSYVCDDARFVIQLFQKFSAELNEPGNERLRFIYEIEKEILSILCDMQNIGVSFDWEKFHEDFRRGNRMQDFFSAEVRKRFAEDLNIKSFDRVVNFNSAQQMRKLLYSDLGLTTTRVTKSGAYSTDEVALLGLASQSRGAAKLGEYKKFMKNLGFYKTWEVYQDSWDERIHSNLSQTMVPSGRFASNDPNIQNIKKEFWFQVGDEDRAVLLEKGRNGRDYWHGSQRGYLRATEGHTLLSYDVSQGELRVLAGLANETHLRNAFDTGLDVHTATAAQMFHVDYSAVTKDLRSKGKTLNFALLYGQGAKALAEQLNVSLDEAVQLMDDYFSAFQRVKQWVVNQHTLAHRVGFVETFLGRRVTLWDANSLQDGLRAKAERLAVNCFDAETEALTQRGWVKGFDLLPTDRLLTYRAEDGGLEWRTPVHRWFYPEYDGPLEHLGNGNGLDTWTTPDHRWAAKSKKYFKGIPQVKTTDELVRMKPNQSDWSIPTAGNYTQPWSVYTDDFATLVGWVLTDGYFVRSGETSGWGAGIAQTKSHRRVEIEALLTRMGLTWGVQEPGEGKSAQYTFRGPIVQRLLSVVTPEKNLSTEFLLGLGDSARQALFDAMMAGDGCVATHSNFVRETFAAGTELRADMFQFLCVLLGKATKKYFRKYPAPKDNGSEGCWLVSIYQRTTAQIPKRGRVETSTGGVWCVTVPNSFAVFRRAGGVFISGNSPVQGGLADIVKLSMIRAARVLKREGWWGDQVRLLMNQHDSLVFEVKNNLSVENVYEKLLPAVEFNPSGTYPLHTADGRIRQTEIKFPDFVTDWEVGTSWGEMEVFGK